MLPNSLNGLRRRQKLATTETEVCERLKNFHQSARWSKNLKSRQRRQKLATTETEVCERLKTFHQSARWSKNLKMLAN